MAATKDKLSGIRAVIQTQVDEVKRLNGVCFIGIQVGDAVIQEDSNVSQKFLRDLGVLAMDDEGGIEHQYMEQRKARAQKA